MIGKDGGSIHSWLARFLLDASEGVECQGDEKLMAIAAAPDPGGEGVNVFPFVGVPPETDRVFLFADGEIEVEIWMRQRR